MGSLLSLRTSAKRLMDLVAAAGGGGEGQAGAKGQMNGTHGG